MGISLKPSPPSADQGRSSRMGRLILKIRRAVFRAVMKRWAWSGLRWVEFSGFLPGHFQGFLRCECCDHPLMSRNGLPRSGKRAGRSQRREPPRPPGASVTRILIADDHEVVRSGLRSILEAHEGWQVVAEASDGKEAIAQAIETKPDV